MSNSKTLLIILRVFAIILMLASIYLTAQGGGTSGIPLLVVGIALLVVSMVASKKGEE